MGRRNILRVAAVVLCLSMAAAGGPLRPISVSVAAAEASSTAVEAADAAFRGRFGDAGDFARRAGDEAASKLVELIYLRDSWKEAGYRRIMNFLDEAPNWPLAETLMRRAEQCLWANNEPATVVLSHFAGRQPLTADGMLALARAERATGNDAAAREWLSKAWVSQSLGGKVEQQALSEFGGLLSETDHKRRVAALIYAQETSAAVQAAKRLSGDYQAGARAAQALIRGTGGAERQYQSLPSSIRQWLPVQYALARYYRKLDKDSKARAILLQIPSDPKVIGDPEAWWIERRIVARKSLGPDNRGSWNAAYRIAAAHGFTSGPYAVEGDFLAGWIALCFLKDPASALKHFARIETIAPTRTDLARARYWMGRAYAALGSSGEAKVAYRGAAKFPTIFYGQLAREQVGLAKTPAEMAGGQPSAAARARIDRDEVVRAFSIVAATTRKRELGMFLPAFASRFTSIDDMNAAANVAWNTGGPVLAVRLAKLAAAKNLDIDYWGYPTRAIPDWTHVGPPVERSLVYGLSRQESEFDPNAGSKVGAQGLMQLMPSTAKLVARQYRVSYAASRLTGDPAYNVKLGAAHLGDLIADYNGSYILTLVAYNAGPRRAREWVATYGDPRSPTVDPIDWIESIPFQETRQYVQKVLQNTQTYRARLAPETMQGMTADLRRGAPKAITIADNAEGESHSAGCSPKPGSIVDLISDCE